MTPAEIFDKCISGEWRTNGDDVQWKTWTSAGKRYLAFQATGTMQEYWISAKIWPRKWYGLAHAGYVDHLLSWIIDPTLSINLAKPVILCGYSLGGALAILLSDYAPGCEEVITFAAPRSKFIFTKSSKKITRYEMRGDPVPHLPFAFLGYKHIGDGVRLGKFSLFNPAKHQWTAYAEALKCPPK